MRISSPAPSDVDPDSATIELLNGEGNRPGANRGNSRYYHIVVLTERPAFALLSRINGLAPKLAGRPFMPRFGGKAERGLRPYYARVFGDVEMTRLTFALAFLALAAECGSAGAVVYPFAGKWNCEGNIFIFSNRTADNGDGTMLRIRKIKRHGDNYRLDFAGGYSFSLLGVAPKTLTWRSLATGDTFACRRLCDRGECD